MELVSDKEGEIWSLFCVIASECLLSRFLLSKQPRHVLEFVEFLKCFNLFFM